MPIHAGLYVIGHQCESVLAGHLSPDNALGVKRTVGFACLGVGDLRQLAFENIVIERQGRSGIALEIQVRNGANGPGELL